MERDLCTLLNTLAVSLLNEAAGSVEKKEGRPVNKGKGKKRAADTGKPPAFEPQSAAPASAARHRPPGACQFAMSGDYLAVLCRVGVKDPCFCAELAMV